MIVAVLPAALWRFVNVPTCAVYYTCNRLSCCRQAALRLAMHAVRMHAPSGCAAFGYACPRASCASCSRYRHAYSCCVTSRACRLLHAAACKQLSLLVFWLGHAMRAVLVPCVCALAHESVLNFKSGCGLRPGVYWSCSCLSRLCCGAWPGAANKRWSLRPTPDGATGVMWALSHLRLTITLTDRPTLACFACPGQKASWRCTSKGRVLVSPCVGEERPSKRPRLESKTGVLHLLCAQIGACAPWRLPCGISSGQASVAYV